MAINVRVRQGARVRQQPRGRLWFEKLMALLALINFLLVLFDWSYLPLRDEYMRVFPGFTQAYGYHIKGIEPHRTTTAYLQTVDRLNEQIAQTGLQSPQTALLLQDLRRRSEEIIEENPFEIAGKSGSLERIKNRMRDRLRQESATQALTTFWSQPYLTQAGWNDSIAFFNREIRPQFASNYFRGIGENGKPIDRFWRIDMWFIGLFAIEMSARILFLMRRYPGLTWLDAIVLRWYDLLLLLPFWRILRIIPVTVRLHRSQLVNLRPISKRVVRLGVSSVAVELTEMVVLRIVDQMQELIRGGAIKRWLFQPDRPYIDLNNVDEVAVLSRHLTDLLVHRVFPKVQPDLDALLHHSLAQAINSSPLYAGLRQIPGMSHWSDQLSREMANQISQNAYRAVTTALEDEVGSALMQKLVSNFNQTFRNEAQQHEALTEIQALTIALLDEVKVNYVERINEADNDSLRSMTQRLYQIPQNK